MENSSSLEASDGVLKSDCNDCNDLNSTLLDASEVSPPQKRSKGKPYEFLKSFSTFDEAFESFGVLPRLREHKWTKHSTKNGKLALKFWFPCKMGNKEKESTVWNATNHHHRLQLHHRLHHRLQLHRLQLQLQDKRELSETLRNNSIFVFVFVTL